MQTVQCTYLAGRWGALDGDALRELPDHPDIEGPAALITDFGPAQHGVMALQGSAAAAAPLIEQRLRREGLTEGESHVEVIRVSVLGDSFQALYSAIPMAHWQRLVAWSEKGGDHRLVFSLIKAVVSRLTPGEAAVVRYERKAFYVHVGAKGTEYADALALHEDADTLASMLAALGDRVRATLAGGERPRLLHWFALDAGEDVDEGALAATFGKASGIDARLAPSTLLRCADGSRLRSSLPDLFEGLHLRHATGSGITRLAYAAERALPVLAGIAAAAALLIGYQALKLDADSRARDAEAALHRAEIGKLEAALRAEPAPDRRADLVDARTFLERLLRAEHNGDLVDELGRLRQLAHELVRILRVRLDPASGKLVVEGVMLPGEGGEIRLSRFVDRLRGAGLSPVTVPPPPGNQIAGFFSYAIERGPTGRPESGA